MNIIILCDQSDCIHNQGAHTGNNHCFERRCHEPNGVIISVKRGCQTKQLSEHALILLQKKDIPIVKLDISVRAFNTLQTNNINTLGDLYNAHINNKLSRFRNLGSYTLRELGELLIEHKLI